MGSFLHEHFVSWFIFLAVLLSSLLLFIGLDTRDFYQDEYQVIGAAYSYHQGHDFYKWDWIENTSGDNTACIEEDQYCHYTRAWPHTWLIAQSYHLFGISEWSSRLVSVLFGLLMAGISYPISYYFTKDRLVSVLVTISVIFMPSFIEMFRYTRMYALLVPLFFLLSYTSSRALLETSDLQFLNKNSAISRFLRKFANFKYAYVFFSLILLALLYQIHVNSLIILPIGGLFVIMLYLFTREGRYLTLLGLGGIAVALASVFIFFSDGAIMGHLGFLTRQNYDYLSYLSRHPFSVLVGGVLLGISFLNIPYYLKIQRYQMLLVYLMVIVSLPFFIWMADRYPSFYYISHIVPFSLILIMVGLKRGVDLLSAREFSSARLVGVNILITTVIGFSILTFLRNIDTIYGNAHDYGQYDIAYETIREEFDPDEQVLFGQYLRTYYLRDTNISYDQIIDMQNKKQYSMAEFQADLAQHQSGWIIWAEDKSYHLPEQMIAYIRGNFQQVHGPDVDETKVFVYYYDQSMISFED